MAFRAKKLLLILQPNQLLFYLNNPLSKQRDLTIKHINVHYQDKYQNYKVSYRKGKPQFLNMMFNTHLKKQIDVAVWSNLQGQITNNLCHKFFGRYYRDLLFILATNRGLYVDEKEEAHTSIKVKKDLTPIYGKFFGYNETNTVVASPYENLLENHRRNDMIVPDFTPKNPDFLQDPGLLPLSKYLSGILQIAKQRNVPDLRRFIVAQQIKNIYKRASFNMFDDTIYK